MKSTEYFDWILPPDIWSKKPRRSSFKLTAEEAQDRHPGAVVVPGSREVRDMPETTAELPKQLTGAPWKGLWPTVGE